MAKKKSRPAETLADMMDESEALEQFVGDDSEAYDVDEDELEALLSDDEDDTSVTADGEPVSEDDDEEDYPDEEEDETCHKCSALLLSDGMCRYCDE
jgi:hypothetical protein